MAIIVLLASTPQAQSAAASIRDEGAYRWVGIYDVNFERGLVSNIGWSGPGAPAYPTFPVTKGLTSKVIAGRKTINVDNVAGDPDYLRQITLVHRLPKEDSMATVAITPDQVPEYVA